MRRSQVSRCSCLFYCARCGQKLHKRKMKERLLLIELDSMPANGGVWLRIIMNVSLPRNSELLMNNIAICVSRKACVRSHAKPMNAILLQFAEFLELENTTLHASNSKAYLRFWSILATHGVESRSAARKLSCLRGLYRWLLLDKRIIAIRH